MIRILNGFRVTRVRRGLWHIEGEGFATSWGEVRLVCGLPVAGGA